MITIILILILFACVFFLIQSLFLKKYNTSTTEELTKISKEFVNSNSIQKFLANKMIELRKKGVDFYFNDITIGRWYLDKLILAPVITLCVIFLLKMFGFISVIPYLIIPLLCLGWFLFDIILYAQNKSENTKMLLDISEMSRSVLYGMQGGQYIVAALKDAIMVVENKRLKTLLIKLNNNINSGKVLSSALEELESSFDSAEIINFCKVIKVLQSTGSVEQSLKNLEKNIEACQEEYDDKQNILLEQKTTIYGVMVLASIVGLIILCLIMNIMQQEILF